MRDYCRVGSVQKETCMMQVQYVNLAPEETKMVNSTFQNIGGNIASFMGTAGEEQVWGERILTWIWLR